jgi:hypothetical protein
MQRIRRLLLGQFFRPFCSFTTDYEYYSSPLTASENPSLTNDLPPEEVDLSWEASEQPNFQPSETSPFPEFSNSSLTNNFFTPDFPQNDPLQSSYSDEPSLCSTNTLSTEFDAETTFGEDLSQLPTYSLDMEGEMSYDPLLDFEDGWQVQSTPASDRTQRKERVDGQSSEDPFMGWASKRSNQMCQDYGWVLSHVETL